ncbi:MAG: hypothetical protein QOI35_3869 [Cryptosporangiaceae bacterium]|nr:hypothetical protein [Cryptosporangiaceae bacterium]
MNSLLPITATTAGRITRALALAVLVVAGAAGLLTADPPFGDLQSFLHDLHAGKVTRIQYSAGDSTTALRWSTGPLHWWRLDSTSVESAPEGTVDLRATVDREITASGHRPEISYRGGSSLWTGNLPWWPLTTIASIVWFATFFVMLGRREHRYANRWAWFWMFTFGAVGSLLDLLAEPAPLWARRDLPPRDPDRRILGGNGFLLAILLSLVVSAAGWALHRLIPGTGMRFFSGLDIAPVLATTQN